MTSFPRLLALLALLATVAIQTNAFGAVPSPNVVPARPGASVCPWNFGTLNPNVVIFGDVSGTSLEIGGVAYVGGNLKTTGSSVGDRLPSPGPNQCNYVTLAVGGKVDPSTTGRVFNGAVAVHTSDSVPDSIANPAGSAPGTNDLLCSTKGLTASQFTSMYNVGAAKAAAVLKNAAWSAMPSTVKFEFPSWGGSYPSLVSVDGSPLFSKPNIFGMHVLNLSPAEISGLSNSVDAHAALIHSGKPLIINLPYQFAITTGDWSWIQSDRVVWNANPRSTGIEVRVMISGMLMAPKAVLSGGAYIQGAAFIGSLANGQGISFAGVPPTGTCSTICRDD
ncbi:hypothetical protein BC828DRAFT_390889 [Blastocladiella britannica]|nr:hypothetical protein BC828DRAFT_390889 [Blastocladiella britannica]